MGQALGSLIGTSATSGGGVTGPQTANAKFQGAQEAVGGAQTMSNIPIGTGSTFATAVGPGITTATELAKQSDADAAAQQANISSTVGGGLGALGSLGSVLK